MTLRPYIGITGVMSRNEIGKVGRYLRAEVKLVVEAGSPR